MLEREVFQEYMAFWSGYLKDYHWAEVVRDNGLLVINKEDPGDLRAFSIEPKKGYYLAAVYQGSSNQMYRKNTYHIQFREFRQFRRCVISPEVFPFRGRGNPRG